MLIRSLTATTALALITIVAAEPEPERPRIYFPREIKREFSNSSITDTDTLSAPESVDNAVPGTIEAPNSRATSPTSSEDLGTDFPSDNVGSEATGSSSFQYQDITVTHVSPSAVNRGNSASLDVIVTRTSGKTSPRPTSKADPSVHDGSTTPTSDAGIVIAPTGIVAPSSTTNSRFESNDRITSSRKPTATNSESVKPATPIGDAHTPPNEPSAAPGPSKGGISDTVKGPARITTSRHATSDFAGTGVSSAVVPHSSAESAVSGSLYPVVSKSVPPNPSETAPTGITKSSATTPFVGTAPEPASTIVKPDPVVAPTGGVLPVSTSKTGGSELPKTSSVGVLPDTPLASTAPEPASTIVKPDPIVASTGGVVSVSTSKSGDAELLKTSSIGVLPATLLASTASKPANTIVKPDPVVAPTGGVLPVSTSKTGGSELPKTSSVGPASASTYESVTTPQTGSSDFTKTSAGPLPSTTLVSVTTHKTGGSASIESSTLGLLPIASSITPISKPLESVISGILPGTNSVKSTATSTESPTESTLPTPVAVLPTGSSPTMALPSQSASLPSSGGGVPAETATTMSPNTSVMPSPSAVLPVDSTAGLTTLSSTDVSLNKTDVEVSSSTGGPVVIPAEPSSATATATGKNPEIPVANSTTPETATVISTSANTLSTPPIPVVNSADPADATSLPTGPVTLPPATSSGGVKSSTPSYGNPNSFSRPSSVSSGVGLPSSSVTPVDSSTAMTTPTRAPPATNPVHTESKSTQPPSPGTSTAVTHPDQPTTITTPKPFPTGVPKYFTPKDSDLLPPRDTENITIGFRNVVSPQYPNDKGATFNFSQKAIALLPAALSLSFNSTITDQIRVFRVEVCHDQPEWGSAIALVSFPNGQGMVSKLQMDLAFPSSPVYNSGNATLESVTSKIDSTFNVLSKYCSGGSTGGGAVPGDGGGTPSDTKPPNDSFGNPVGDDKQTRQSVRTTSFIVVGAVSFGVMYGAAMFVLARRYKRKKQSHRRSNSVTNSQNSSEMRYTGGGSPALMGGALLSREYFNYGAGGRDSRGSGRSGMGNSGRTANISAPVAAENSLGWN